MPGRLSGQAVPRREEDGHEEREQAEQGEDDEAIAAAINVAPIVNGANGSPAMNRNTSGDSVSLAELDTEGVTATFICANAQTYPFAGKLRPDRVAIRRDGSSQELVGN